MIVAAFQNSSIPILASFVSFYSQGSWAEATKTMLLALQGFTLDITFSVDITFAWPYELPGIAQWIYGLALSVVVLQQLLGLWNQIYHKFLKAHGQKLIQEARSRTPESALGKIGGRSLAQMLLLIEYTLRSIIITSELLDFQIQKLKLVSFSLRIFIPSFSL